MLAPMDYARRRARVLNGTDRTTSPEMRTCWAPTWRANLRGLVFNNPLTMAFTVNGE